MALSFMEGNEAIALGAMAAGCNFFAGYPIFRSALSQIIFIHHLLKVV